MYQVHAAKDECKQDIAKELAKGIWHVDAPKCVSVVIDSKEPGFVKAKVWTDEERNEGLQLGLACIRTWQIAKKYRPEGCIL
jgi:hypothetical protein